MTGRELLEAMYRESNLWSKSADHIAATPSGAELIRRADAEPVLREALDGLYAYHDDATHRCSNDHESWRADCPVAAARAALTTPDAPG